MKLFKRIMLFVGLKMLEIGGFIIAIALGLFACGYLAKAINFLFLNGGALLWWMWPPAIIMFLVFLSFIIVVIIAICIGNWEYVCKKIKND